MDLKNFCTAMALSAKAYQLLEPHWEKILQEWQGKVPEFVSEEYLKKYLPFLQIPDDEEEILLRARKVIARCAENEAESLYLFVLYYGAFVLKLQLNPDLQSSVWGEDDGIAALIASLSSLPLIEENCRKRGIPEHYATDALQWIGGTVAIYKLSHNNIPGHSLQQLYWLHHHIDGKLYRIGRFEYLIHTLPSWAPCIFRNSDMTDLPLRFGAVRTDEQNKSFYKSKDLRKKTKPQVETEDVKTADEAHMDNVVEVLNEARRSQEISMESGEDSKLEFKQRPQRREGQRNGDRRSSNRGRDGQRRPRRESQGEPAPEGKVVPMKPRREELPKQDAAKPAETTKPAAVKTAEAKSEAVAAKKEAPAQKSAAAAPAKKASGQNNPGFFGRMFGKKKK